MLPVVKLKKDEFKAIALKVLGVAAVMASFTRDERDDNFVSLLMGNVNDPAQFDKLCDVLGIKS